MYGGYNPLMTFLMSRGLGGWQGTATPGIAGPLRPTTDPMMGELPVPPEGVEGEAEVRRRGFLDRLAPRNYQGAEVPPELGRESVNRAAMLFGLNLLGESMDPATTGRWSALPRALGAGLQAQDASIAAGLERRRQGEKDRMEAERHGETMATSRQGREHADEEQGWQRAQARRLDIVWGREDEDREGKRSSARAMVEEIKSVAGEDSYEARRAEALLLAGPESLPDLRSLHEESVNRVRLDDDFDADTERGIRRGRAEIEAGVAGDPRVGDAYTRRLTQVAGTYGSGRAPAGTPTPTSFNDDVRQEAARIYGVLKDEAEAAAERAYKADESLDAPPAVDYRGLEEQARREAESVVRGRYGSGPAPAGGEGEGGGVTEAQVAAVRSALGSRSREEVIAGLRARRVPEDKIAELLRRAGE